MNRLMVHGKLLLLMGITVISFGQTPIERTAISKTVNLDKLQYIINKEERKKEFQRSEVERLKKLGYEEFMIGEDGSFSQLVGTDEWGNPIYLQTLNQIVVNSMGADVLHTGFDGFNLTGDHMLIGLWEAKNPRLNHEILRVDFSSPYQSRISYDTNTQSYATSGIDIDHATQVAGTLIGNQTNMGSAHQLDIRGVAYEALINAYDWNLTASEMAAEAASGLLVANTSYGENVTFLEEEVFGKYSSVSADWDAVMCAAPYLQIVRPAGNTRDDSPYIVPQVNLKVGFDLLESSAVSKNVLVVGAFDLADAEPSSTIPVYDLNDIETLYSSWGPTDDGRIKPDITAHGHNVLTSSSASNNSYSTWNGTSMATAGVSGAITLLQQYYNQKYGELLDPSEVPYLWSSTIRGLIIHTADEVGAPGPDYKYGWGAMNATSAAHIIEERGKSTIIREETLDNDTEFRLNVVANGYEPLVITLAWTDPEGELSDENPPILDESTSKLINDLDVRLIRLDSNGEEISDNLLLPWKMLNGVTFDVNQLNAAATRGDNSVDNVEKIEIPIEALPEYGGLYQVLISHKGTLVDNCIGHGQNFSLIVSGVAFCRDTIELFQHHDDIITEYEEGLHLKADNITASNYLEPVLDPNSDETLVEYEAGSWIELVPQGGEGFTADYGADFFAHIDCQLDTSNAFSSRELESMRKNQVADESIPMNNSVVIFPNPVINNLLNIQFELDQSSSVEIILYYIQGSEIHHISAKEFDKGKHKQVLDLSDYPSGIYIVKVLTPFKSYTEKIIKK